MRCSLFSGLILKWTISRSHEAPSSSSLPFSTIAKPRARHLKIRQIITSGKGPFGVYNLGFMHYCHSLLCSEKGNIPIYFLDRVPKITTFTIFPKKNILATVLFLLPTPGTVPYPPPSTKILLYILTTYFAFLLASSFKKFPSLSKQSTYFFAPPACLTTT